MLVTWTHLGFFRVFIWFGLLNKNMVLVQTSAWIRGNDLVYLIKLIGGSGDKYRLVDYLKLGGVLGYSLVFAALSWLKIMILFVTSGTLSKPNLGEGQNDLV